ncbi:Arp10p NDAI_0J01440 [Naumovozyma dairenensis CBS 421]|uniref:Uncharacterized protein n=1 Tax=Naumovozyma dairenensis (strain ATCC 10597 / BCRC 20456 / CBS 421 / NBRC 0211 / NRRL Y-12639) TaxID=1071378 RepID=G0WGV8_NAUDC|nr:hypothetical protein NDAI_0J01440 [Naumovozyma dairenensis CBS 421]CCD27036.1 hypothetical protein NDAI_0J01440 [Naumovozyma dairenensis CBS 421]
MNNIIIFDINWNNITVGIAGSSEPAAKYFPKDHKLLFEQSDSEIYELFDNCFQKGLDVSADGTNVVIWEDTLFSVAEKRRYCKILLQKMNCSKVMFIPRCLLYCISNNVSNALVVEVNYHQITCVPIYDLRIIDEHLRTTKGALNCFSQDNNFGVTDQSVEEMHVQNLFKTPKSLKKPDYDDDELPIVILIKELVKSLQIDIVKPLTTNLFITGIDTKLEKVNLDSTSRLPLYGKVLNSTSLWDNGSRYSLSLFMDEKSFEHLQISQNDITGDNFTIPDWYELKFKGRIIKD